MLVKEWLGLKRWLSPYRGLPPNLMTWVESRDQHVRKKNQLSKVVLLPNEGCDWYIHKQTNKQADRQVDRLMECLEEWVYSVGN